MKGFSKFAGRSAMLVASVLFAGSTTLRAGVIPYSSAGNIAPTAVLDATGNAVTAYYAGSSAGDTDYIQILDATKGTETAEVFDNQTTTEGTTVSLSTSIGDIIVIDVINSNGYASPDQPVAFSSDPADSADGVNHAYITPITNAQVSTTFVDDGTTFMNFTGAEISAIEAAGNPYFVGMEDEYYPSLQGTSTDLDYNDDTLVLTGVSATPEPSSLMLLGTGLVGAAGFFYRRRQHQAA